MKIEDRLKTYVGFSDISRRWTSVMDAKAAFLSALNGGLLAFLWGSVKIDTWVGMARYFGVAATLVSVFSLMSALWVITPRQKFSSLVGKRSRWSEKYKPFSFYGYIASNYKQEDFKSMEAELAAMGDAEFAHEALEQHFNISMVIQEKSELIFRTTILALIALGLVVISLSIKCFW